jgi:hypothetical protein
MQLKNSLTPLFLFMIFYHATTYCQTLPEYVNLSGEMKSIKGKLWLQTDSSGLYLLNYHDADSMRYIDHRVRASGYLLQGYDNPKYGKENLPIEQIDPKDRINIITGVKLQKAER